MIKKTSINFIEYSWEFWVAWIFLGAYWKCCIHTSKILQELKIYHCTVESIYLECHHLSGKLGSFNVVSSFNVLQVSGSLVRLTIKYLNCILFLYSLKCYNKVFESLRVLILILLNLALLWLSSLNALLLRITFYDSVKMPPYKICSLTIL